MTPVRLVLAGWVLLTLAWTFANPQFAGPDEHSHYLRAIEVGRGHLITEHRPDLATGGTEAALRRNRELTYEVHVPAGKAPPDTGCYIHDRDADASCLDSQDPPREATDTTTAVGNYQPLTYVLPGLALRLADSPGPALRLARLANALLTLALLYIALRMAWSPDAGPISLLGPLVAVTPMAIYSGAVLNGSGPEVAAGVAFAAGLMRLRRDESCARSPLVWAGIAATGVVLALARTVGPLWLVLIAAAALALHGPRTTRAYLRAGGRAALGALGAVAVAIGLNLAWERAHGPDLTTGFADLRSVLDEAVGEWWRASSELIGKFGYLEFRLPWLEYVAWFAAGLGLVAIALRAGARRERLVLAAAVGGALLLPMLMWIYAIRQTGYGLQGRYVLPLLAIVPVTAGELIRAHAAAIPARTRRALLVAVPPVVGTVHLLAFLWNARRSAVGLDGPLAFTDPGWSPPLGWIPWIAAATAGAAALVAAVLPRGGPAARPAQVRSGSSA